MFVFIDINVWYPGVLADLAWCDESLAEVERVLVERKGLSATNAAVRSLSSPKVASETLQKSHPC